MAHCSAASFPGGLPWPSHGLSGLFTPVPRHTPHLLQSLPLEPTHVLGSPTLCFSPTRSYSGSHPQKRQLRVDPSPPVCPLAITPELEEVRGENPEEEGRTEGAGSLLMGEAG